MTCHGESCRQGRTTCTEGCEFISLAWLTELLLQIATFFICAGAFGLVAGITYALIHMARGFTFL